MKNDRSFHYNVPKLVLVGMKFSIGVIFVVVKIKNWTECLIFERHLNNLIFCSPCFYVKIKPILTYLKNRHYREIEISKTSRISFTAKNFYFILPSTAVFKLKRQYYVKLFKRKGLLFKFFGGKNLNFFHPFIFWK